MKTRQVSRTIYSMPPRYSMASVTEDGNLLAGWSPDDDVRVWKVGNDSSLQDEFCLSIAADRHIANAVDINVDGSGVLTGSVDGTLRV